MDGARAFHALLRAEDLHPAAREIDLRVGGRFLWCMRWPDGRENDTSGEYVEIVPLESLVYTTTFADAEGKAVPASYYGMGDDIAFEMNVTVIFNEQDGKTTLTLTHEGLPAGEIGDSAREGWIESLNKHRKPAMARRNVVSVSKGGEKTATNDREIHHQSDV